MIELYFFVNPIDNKQETSLSKLTSIIHHSQQNIKFHIIPIVTLPLMDQYFNSHLIPRSQLGKRNILLKQSYKIALNFEKIASLNKQKAIQYLIQINKETQNLQFDDKQIDDLCLEYGKKINSNFLNNQSKYQSLATEKLKSNINLAQEMGIHSYASLVIYNFNKDEDIAIRLDYLDNIDNLNCLLNSNCLKEAIEKESMFSN